MRKLLMISLLLLAPGPALADGEAIYRTVTGVAKSSSGSDGVDISTTIPDGACYLVLVGFFESRGNENCCVSPDSYAKFDDGGSNEFELGILQNSGAYDCNKSSCQLAAAVGSFWGTTQSGDLTEDTSFRWNDSSQNQQGAWVVLIENSHPGSLMDFCGDTDFSSPDNNPKCSANPFSTDSVIVWGAGGRGHDTTPVSSVETDNILIVDTDTCVGGCGSTGADDGLIGGYVEAEDHTTASLTVGATMAASDDWALHAVEVRARPTGECDLSNQRRLGIISKLLYDWLGMPDPTAAEREYFSKPRVIGSATTGAQTWYGRYHDRNQSPKAEALRGGNELVGEGASASVRSPSVQDREDGT